jgi:hypothetical protein
LKSILWAELFLCRTKFSQSKMQPSEIGGSPCNLMKSSPKHVFPNFHASYGRRASLAFQDAEVCYLFGLSASTVRKLKQTDHKWWVDPVVNFLNVGYGIDVRMPRLHRFNQICRSCWRRPDPPSGFWKPATIDHRRGEGLFSRSNPACGPGLHKLPRHARSPPRFASLRSDFAPIAASSRPIFSSPPVSRFPRDASGSSLGSDLRFARYRFGSLLRSQSLAIAASIRFDSIVM